MAAYLSTKKEAKMKQRELQIYLCNIYKKDVWKVTKLALNDEILLKIQQPARYIGNEVNMVKKDPEGKIRVVFGFPDVNVKNI